MMLISTQSEYDKALDIYLCLLKLWQDTGNHAFLHLMGVINDALDEYYILSENSA
jgi:hypothetical protein